MNFQTYHYTLSSNIPFVKQKIGIAGYCQLSLNFENMKLSLLFAILSQSLHRLSHQMFYCIF